MPECALQNDTKLHLFKALLFARRRSKLCCHRTQQKWSIVRSQNAKSIHYHSVKSKFKTLTPEKYKVFISSIPTLKPLLHKKCNVSLPPSTVFLAALQMRCKNIDTLLLGTPGILCGWALQGYFSVGPCRDIWWLDNAGILCSWARQAYFAVGHCRDSLRWGTARILSG